MALSHSLRDIIPLLGLIKELKEVISREENTPKVYYSVFENNKGCIDMVKAPKMRPRTKYIVLNYHHFQSHIGNTLSIQYIETRDQIADIFTKTLNNGQFCKLRKSMNGWCE